MESFFGNSTNVKRPPMAGPIVSKVYNKAPIKPKYPIISSGSVPKISPSSLNRPSAHTSTSSSKAQPKHSSYTTGTNSTTGSSKYPQSRLSSTPTSSRASPSVGARPNTKRKISHVDKIESESESSSDSGSEAGPSTPGAGSSSSMDAGSKRSITKQHGAGLGKKSKTNGTKDILMADKGEEKLGREVFCPEQVDERGEWGRGWAGFVPGEEVVRGQRRGWAGGNGDADKVVLLDKYVAYFPQPGFEKADPLPCVELLYPATGCRESYPLLTPTTAREFSPLRELRTALQMIFEFYIPPSHQHIFGKLSDSLTDFEIPSTASRLQSPMPGTPSTPPPFTSASSPSVTTPTPAAGPTETIADAIRKALAPNRRDGPGFIKAMNRYNTAMEELQAEGSMSRWLATRGPTITRREWAKVVDVVHDQAYSRVVGPYSNELEHHPKHPEEIAKAITAKEDAYGELRHTFMSKVIEQTCLSPSSVFVDLGSGVGNCVMQAALQAGCPSYGFELLPVPAHCARLQLRETQRRWSMWCLKGNTEVEVHEGDFRVHPEVSKRLRDADVVLVNNEVFPSSLNGDLTDMFLDLKEGAKIVSLKPFVPEGFRMNESNCDSFAAIVKLHTHSYHRDWVSWKGDSGKYYIQVIDRSMRRKYEEEMNNGSARRRR